MKRKTFPYSLFAAASLLAAGSAILVLATPQAAAETYYMTADETTNSSTTSFNGVGNWNAGGAPAAENDYVTAYQLRTPNNANANNTFAGDSLRLDGPGGQMNLTPSQDGTYTITVNNLILNGGSVAVFRSNTNLILAGGISTQAESRLRIGTGANTGIRNVTVNSTITGSAQIEMYAQNISSSSLTVNGNNSSFSGGFILNSGDATHINSSLVVGNANALGTGVTDVRRGTLNLNGHSVTIGGLAGNNVTDNFVQNNSNTAAILSVGSNNLNSSYAGVIQDGSGTGNLGLAKTGDGALTLSGNNTYSGDTLVSAGTLFVSGSLGSGSDVTVGANGTIGGGGTIGGSLHFDSGADFAFNASQTLTVNGASVTFGNFGIANLFGFDGTVDVGTYYLINGTATVSTTNLANLGAGQAVSIGGGKSAYFEIGSLNVVVIPEPTAAILGSLGMLVLLRRRRT